MAEKGLYKKAVDSWSDDVKFSPRAKEDKMFEKLESEKVGSRNKSKAKGTPRSGHKHDYKPIVVWYNSSFSNTIHCYICCRCSICGKKTDKLDAHEVWSYDIDKGIQKLENVISVCKDCHSVIHIERTELKGDIERAEKHYMKINGCNYSEYRQARGRANDRQKELNKIDEWLLDLTFLKRYIKY